MENKNYVKIYTDDNLMETIKHGAPEYPFQFYNDNLRLFYFRCIEWHWHEEVEFVFIKEGNVSFWIDEHHFTLSPNNAIFINSKVLHRFSTQENGIIPNIVFLPSFIANENSLIYTKYVLPIISSSIRYMTFSQDIPWQHDVLSLLKQVINDCQFTNDNELLISSNMQKIWHLMVNNCNISCLSKTKTNGTSRLQLMMHYIHNNYAKCLTLEEICNVVYISKSTSLNLFRKYLNTTPIKYLIKYRLQVASKLLLNSKKTIYSISSDCGFENVDYFCKTFKKHYNVTPSTYRKNQNQN